MPLKNSVSRYDWVDAAKAVGIMFVVLGHHRNHFLYDYIYTFHMPLFFFLSGVMFRLSPSQNFRSYLLKRAQSLLIPYFVFSFLLFGVWWFLGRFVDPTLLDGYSLLKNFLGIFYSQGQMEYMRWGTEMWFLPCLFVTSLIYYFVAKLSRLNQFLAVMVLSFVGFLLPGLIGFRLPWSVDVALVAVGFYWLGHLLRDQLLDSSFGLKGALVALGFLALNVCAYIYQGVRVDIYQAIYGNLFLFYLSAVSGILFYVLLAKIVSLPKVILFVGVNSLIIYMLHMRALTVVNFVTARIPGLQLDDSTFIVVLLISIAQILLVVPAILILNRFFPYLIGKGFTTK